jgi:hypothetical protein
MGMLGIIKEVGWIGKRERKRVGMITSLQCEKCSLICRNFVTCFMRTRDLLIAVVVSCRTTWIIRQQGVLRGSYHGSGLTQSYMYLPPCWASHSAAVDKAGHVAYA